MKRKRVATTGMGAIRLAFGLLAGLYLGAPLTARAETVTATGARVTGDQAATRFTADLSAPVSYTVYVLPDPYRVLIDAPSLNFNLPPDAGLKAKGLVSQFRYGQVDTGKSRIVMDVKGPVLITKSFLQPAGKGEPAHLVVDLVPTSKQAFDKTYRQDAMASATAIANAQTTGSAPSPDATAETAAADDAEAASQPLALPQPAAAPPEPQKAAPASGKKLVVIDPGHGGVDPGAIGVSGKREKDVTLAFSAALRDVLIASGRYDVILTRDDDRFMSLEDRAKLAHDKRADLFICIHADSERAHDARGATIYTLSDKASDPEAAALAIKENRADLIGGVSLSGQSEQVSDILINLTQRESKKHSILFARKAVAAMKPVTGFTPVPMRSAGFLVLKIPDVPSVLIELGFVTTAADEAQLVDSRWRAKVSAAMAKAVDQYFATTIAASAQ